MARVVLLSLLILSVLHAASQEADLSGFVYDSQDQSPIEGVLLRLEPGIGHTISNEQGAYYFENIPFGNYKLHVERIGYQTSIKDIEVSSVQGLHFDILLIPSIETLDEFVVCDHFDHHKISKLPYLESYFVQREINESAASDIGEFLRGSANINGIRKGGTSIDPVIRGFKFSQLNVMLNDGQKIEGGCPNRMDPTSAHVEIEDIARIQVVKGPYLLQYGPAFGGLLNLKTHSLPWEKNDPIHVFAGQSFESNGSGQKGFLRLEGNYKKLFYQFSGSHKKYGNYADGDGREVSSAFTRYNYKGLIGFQAAKGHQMSVGYEESKGRDVRFPALPMDERSDDTRLMSMDYLIEPNNSKLQQLKFKMYRSAVRHEMDNKYRPVSDTVVAVSVIDALNQGGRINANWAFEKFNVSAGIDFENIRKDGDRTKSMILQPGLPVIHEKLWNNAEINNLGFYFGLERKINNWEIMFSARLDNNNATSDAITVNHPSQGEIFHFGTDSISSDFTNFSFSFGVLRNLTEKIKISLAIGRGARSPDMIERFIILLPIGYDKFDYLGNPLLEPEVNYQVDLTLTHTCKRSGIFQINGFYSLVENYITGQRLPPSQQKPLSKDVLGVKQFYNADRARLRGFELTYLTPDLNNWGGSLSASYTYGTIDQVKQYVLNSSGDVVDDVEIKNDALTEIPPMEGSVKVHYHLADGKILPQLGMRFVAAQKHVSLASYEQTSEAFALVNFSLNYRINSMISLIGGVKNIFDAAYYEHLNRNIIGSATNLYEPGRSFYINILIEF